MIKNDDGEGSTSNVPQPIVEPMVPSRNNSEVPRDPSPLLPHGLTPPMPSTIMDFPIPSPMMDSLMP
ncbi:hypothetical protein H5410_028116 [Solanum commersonii]|uniref:Uncharacterized protein n=1 Tax=Solanum commersonii TaxID=4109 RepID=A0A9J5Z3W4_SOLCO|nr:hypothetical protein H5410_028116 [Solanum commersonii]